MAQALPKNKPDINKKSSVKPSSTRPKLHKKTLALLLIFIVVGSVLLYRHHNHVVAVNKERAAFESTSDRLKALTDKLNVLQPKPYYLSKTQECTRPHLDYVKGQLACETGYILAYGAENRIEAQLILEKLNTYIIKSEKIGTAYNLPNGKLEFTNLNNANDSVERSVTYGYAGLKCGIDYQYMESGNDSPNYIHVFPTESQLVLISLSCGGSAKEAYYPIK